MTQTVDRPRSDVAVRVENWLNEFGQALSAGDGERVAGLFAAESYWRDLVSFTWNLITVEGPAGAADLATSDATRGVAPVTFTVTGEPTEAGTRGMRLPARALDSVAVISGSRSRVDLLSAIAARGATGVVLLVDDSGADEIASASSSGGVRVLRGPRSLDLAKLWDRIA